MSPSSERLHSKMWFHRFDVISVSIICLGEIICDINTIGFVSVCACRVCDALVANCATVHKATQLSMKQNGHPTINEGMTQLI